MEAGLESMFQRSGLQYKLAANLKKTQIWSVFFQAFIWNKRCRLYRFSHEEADLKTVLAYFNLCIKYLNMPVQYESDLDDLNFYLVTFRNKKGI